MHTAEVPAGFTEEVLATDLNAATAMAPLPDGRIFIADQTGQLLLWKDGHVLDPPALTLHVTDYWERGLIGVTLHPDFPHTPQIFVLYVTDRPFVHHVLSRFTMNGDVVDPASEVILFEGDDQAKLAGHQPAGHQGGPIRFGTDGKLYVGLGEQTARDPSQRLDTLQGKILRLNPDGSIPEDNPFYIRTSGKYRAIWAYGIRNPFGLAFQPETGRCFVTDVGESSWEEVDEIFKGANYGWPLAEGMSTNSAFRNPLYTYPPVIGRSIVGAAFYPRTSKPDVKSNFFPQKWRGKFFFADWAAHWVKALDPDAPAKVVTFARGLNAPVAVDVAPDGSLLVLNRGTIWRDNKSWQANTGSLVRIRYTGVSPEVATRPPLPKTLAAADVFASLTSLTPRVGFTEFTINVPPDQPGVIARRWMRLPEGGHLAITPGGDFEFPNGATVIQHYCVEKTGAPLETQVLWFTDSRACRAAAYRWANGTAQDPKLVEEGEIIALPGDDKRHWFSPGAEENLNLDLVVTGFLLPLNERQINRDGQLESWNDRGWFAPRLRPAEIAAAPHLSASADTQASPEWRVRSYLDVNCAACHHPGGPSRGNFDARFVTPLPEQKLLAGELAAGDLGLRDAHVIVPGHPERSVMFQRLKRTDFFRMPPVSVNDEPARILPVLEEWIRSLPVSAK